MGIDINTALQIDNLVNEGLSIREIADKLNLNREFVRRYTKHEIPINKVLETDTEMTQIDTNTNKSSFNQDNNKLKKDIIQEVKQLLQEFKGEIPTDFNINVLNDWKKDLLTDIKTQVKQEKEINREIRFLKGSINQLNEVKK